jgi:hypothetical protein
MDMNVCLDLHDFSVVNNRLLWLLTLKDRFPGFKVSLFTVPIDTESDWGAYTVRNEYLKEIKKNLSWIQIIPHGLYHLRNEFLTTTYDEFKEVIKKIDEAFSKDGLPYEKGFCAPHWRWTEGVVKALDEAGWWGAIDPRQTRMLKTKKYYIYSHTIDSNLSNSDMKLHGHIYGTKNDIAHCFDNLLTLPADTKWHFVTDYLEGGI